MVEFRIDPSDRVLLVGTTGSGKSTVARALTAGYRSQVVIDAKHEESLARAVICRGAREFRVIFPARSKRVLFRPDPALDGADVDEVIARVLTFGRTALIVHDAALYATVGTILPAYKRAQILGRSIGVPVWSLVQRPTGVHNVLLSEASHVFVFALHLDSDRTKLAGVVGPGAMIPPGRPFAFGYYGPPTGGHLVACDPLEVRRDPTDDRESRAGDDHGDGRHLRDESAHPELQHPRTRRPRRRDLGRPPIRPARSG